MSPSPPAPSRSPWQILYRAAHRRRRAWYARRAERLDRPVLSVGNLHWGGTGKTPIVAAIARHLRDSGLEVAILSRGYKSEGSGVRIVSRGEGPILGPSVAGDEPVLLASELPGVALVVGPDRVKAGRHSLERLSPPPDLFLLDDGFSHLRLARDLDLLVLPSDDPFGGGRLPPSGRLREPLESSAFADALLLSGSDDGGHEIAAGLRPYGFRGVGFSSPVVPQPARLSPGEPLPPGRRVLLVSGIARDQRFHDTAVSQGFEIVGRLNFSDHHDYPEASLRQISQTLAETRADVVLTTSKDHVKLLGRLDLPLAELPIVAEPEPAFWTWLNSRVGELRTGDR